MFLAYCAWTKKKDSDSLKRLDFNYHNTKLRGTRSMKIELKESWRPRWRENDSMRHLFDPVPANMNWCIVTYNAPELVRLFVESYLVMKVWTERMIKMPYFHDLLCPAPEIKSQQVWSFSQVVQHAEHNNKQTKLLDQDFFDTIVHVLPSAGAVMGLGMLDLHRREQMY